MDIDWRNAPRDIQDNKYWVSKLEERHFSDARFYIASRFSFTVFVLTEGIEGDVSV